MPRETPRVPKKIATALRKLWAAYLADARGEPGCDGRMRDRTLLLLLSEEAARVVAKEKR